MEQLAAYTRVLELDLHTVTSAEGLADAVLAHKGADQIIIDSPGLNPFDPEEMKELATYVRSAKMNVVLTMAGGTDPEEASEIARAFQIIGAKSIVPTRLDMSRRLGGILAAADAADMAFAGAGHGPQVADGFLELDAKGLTDFIVPKKKKAKETKDGKR
jgi:flagellar biosynthesis protein FlhF